MRRVFLMTLGLLLTLFYHDIHSATDEALMATSIEDKAQIPILTPSLQEREIEKIRLDNHLEVYLIHEPSAKQSAASLTVQAGSWSDPKDFPGMAHFCEHMLFLGSEKYPKESEYNDYLKEHGGHANAFTTYESTTYMFAVETEAYQGALDRFAQFFIAPTFTDSATDRERTAVDQEYHRYKENDGWRGNMVQHQVLNKQHPLSRYHMGNLETLSRISREELIKWYESHYSANLMHLVIYSPLPVKTLKAFILESFANIPDRSFSPLHVSVPLSDTKNLPSISFMESIKDLRSLTLSWEIPIELTDHQHKAHMLAAFVLGHEGEGSLLSALKKQDLALSLSAGGGKVGDDQASFSIRIALTEKGLQNYEEVIKLCYQAIHLYQENPLPQYIFDEEKAMALQYYQYQSRANAFKIVTDHARGLLEEELETYPERQSLHYDFAPERIISLFKTLEPNTLSASIVANKEELSIDPNNTEPVFGTRYEREKISEKLVQEIHDLARAPKELFIPKPNPFIAEKVELLHSANPNEKLIPTPIKIRDNESIQAYYCPDKRYLVPKIDWVFSLATPEIKMGDAKSEALRDLYIYAYTEHVNELSYPASIAGLKFALDGSNQKGLVLHVQGTSPKAHDLLMELCKAFKSTLPTEEQFSRYKEALVRSYENQYKADPIQQALRLSNEMLIENVASPREKADALKKISLVDLNKFTKLCFQSMDIEALLYGNLKEDQANMVIDQFQKAIEAKPYPKAREEKVRILRLSEGPSILEEYSDLERNALVLMLQEGDFSFKKRAAQQILSSAVEAPFYETLRTKQQTAYVVWNWSTEEERELMDFFAIESGSHDGRDLLARFELFFESFLKDLESKHLPESRFENIRQSLVSKLSQPPENLYAMGSFLWTLTSKYDGDFDWLQKRLEGLKSVTYADVLEFAKTHYSRDNLHRLALLFNGKLPKGREFKYRKTALPMGDYLSRTERLREVVVGKDLDKAD